MTSTVSKKEDALKFHDAYLTEMSSNLQENFEPKYEDDLFDLDIETRVYVDKSESVLVEDEKLGIFRVFLKFGVRWLRDRSVVEDEKEICATIESEFVAEYIINAPLDQKYLDDFALNNVIADVWPYWRELLTSQCSRMHLTGVKLPILT